MLEASHCRRPSHRALELGPVRIDKVPIICQIWRRRADDASKPLEGMIHRLQDFVFASMHNHMTAKSADLRPIACTALSRHLYAVCCKKTAKQVLH